MIIADWLDGQLEKLHRGKAVKWNIPFHIALSHLKMFDVPLDTAKDIRNGRMRHPRLLMKAAIPTEDLSAFWLQYGYWVVPEMRLFPHPQFKVAEKSTNGVRGKSAGSSTKSRR